jgi:hypothetical protein
MCEGLGGERCRLRPRPSRYKPQSPLQLRGAGTNPFPPEPASGSAVLLRAEARGARPKRSRRPGTIAVPTYRFARQAISLSEEPSRRNDAKRKTFCAMAKTHSQEGHSHQAKICGKLEGFIKEPDDYKSPLSYYPKEARDPQASPCQSRLQEERRGGCQESLAREILAFPSPA